MSLLKKQSPYQSQILPQQKQPAISLHKQNKQIIDECMGQINQTKYLQENMLNKLLRPPAKKQSKSQLKKYDPQFPKPDVERLIHQNNVLKSQITENGKVILELRFRVKQLQKKIGKLQLTCSQQLQDVLQKNKKNTSAHTEILKKKIHQLHTKYISSQSQIKRLKKLPGASIYQQNNIQKQHLLAQTIRLKSILTSYQSSNEELQKAELSDPKQKNAENCTSSLNNAKFQQQFLRMLKEENQKLKATIRLLQNDKILMKARQTTQNKLNTDLKKQLQQSKNRLILKQAQIQKLTHENQNLLFKKAAKFRLQKQQKQNKQIQQLSKCLEQLRLQKKKLQNEKNQLFYDNQELKKKQQDRSCQLIQKDKQLQKIKIQIAQIRNQYDARIKSLQMNKLYSKQSSFGVRSSKDGRFQDLRRFGVIDHQAVKGEMENKEAKDKKKFNWGKTVKFQELDFCLLKIWALKQNGTIQSFDDLVTVDNQLQSTRTKKNSAIGFQQFYLLLKQSPIDLPQKQALKLCKYIFSDHSIPQSQQKSQPTIQISLLITIIKASISKFIECLNNQSIILQWKFLLQKSRKFIKQLQDFVQGGKIKDKKLQKDMLTKDDFINIVVRNKSNTLLFEEINFVMIYAFDCQASEQCIILRKSKILELMHGLTGDNRNGKNLFTQLMIFPKSNKNLKLQKYCSVDQKIESHTFQKKLKNLPRLYQNDEQSTNKQIFINKKQRNKENINQIPKTHQSMKTNFYRRQQKQNQMQKSRKQKLSKLITITHSQSDIEEMEESQEIGKGEKQGVKLVGQTNQIKKEDKIMVGSIGTVQQKDKENQSDQQKLARKLFQPEIYKENNKGIENMNNKIEQSKNQNDNNLDIQLSSLLDQTGNLDDLSALITGSINQEDGESGGESEERNQPKRTMRKKKDSQAMQSEIISGDSEFNIEGNFSRDFDNLANN